VPGPKPHYWIEDATIADANSLRLLAASQGSTHHRKKTGAGKLLLIGDAVSPNADYAELPKAVVEIENIEKHFAPAGREVLTRAQATAPAYVESDPEQFAYIHFVAHGTASRLSPLDSAVILSKASVQEDSFKLYARDIIHHPLHAELVTISTCYGAGTRAYKGEGLVGLSWAFLHAGAHNVIGALWEVSDASTPRLMDELYDELQKGRSPRAALRSAKLSLLRSDSFRKPFYWAPFQLYTGT
jgi:CHAT domain-containing protein